MNAKRLIAAIHAGAKAAELDLIIADIRRDQQIQRDAKVLSKLSHEPQNSAAHEVAALLARARYLMETA